MRVRFLLTPVPGTLAFSRTVRFGFHVSIAGGFARALERAQQLGCESVQFFARNPRGWKAAPLDPDDAARFRRGLRGAGISPAFIHSPYLVNLASDDARLARLSVGAVAQDMERSRRLGLRHVVVHFGRAGSVKESKAISMVARNVNLVLGRTPDAVMLLLENTAGMGSELGFRFEQLEAVIGQARQPERVGVALDTAHLFEAGYELRTRSGVDETLGTFDEVVGLKRLHLIHLNDSKTDIGSQVDRHWHIGKGRIGAAGLGQIVNHPLLSHLPAILETPRKAAKDDQRNLRAARRLVA